MEQCLTPYIFETPRPLAAMVKVGTAAVLRLGFGGDDAFQFLFGLPAPAKGPWPHLQAVFDAQPGDLSLGFVLAALRNMANIYPAEFTALKVHTEGMHDPLNPIMHVPLPREAPEGAHLAIGSNLYCRDARFVVTRALAAVLLNRRVILGAFTETVEAESMADSPLIARWKGLADKVAKLDHHAALDPFLRLYLAPHGNAARPAARRLLSDATDPLVLAVDIGGTGVKVSLYRVDPATGRLGERMAQELTVPTAPDGWNQIVADKGRYTPDAYVQALVQSQYDDARAFVRKIRDGLTQKLGDISERIVAVGVAYPGAVAGKDMSEYVAANSGTLSFFKGIHPTQPWLADVDRIHGLRLREAFETEFAVNGVVPPVRLVNDGTAHVIGHATEFAGAGFGWADWVLGLVVGTGFGSAGYQRASARPIPGLFEVGRVITYVSVPFNDKDKFPAGTARDYLTTSALARIPRDLLGAGAELPYTPSLLLGWVLEGGDVDAFERRWEQERPAQEKRTLAVLRAELSAYLNTQSKDVVSFAGEVADTAGCRLADVVATMVEMTGALNVFAAGGALSGAFGKRIRETAREELRNRYGFDVEMAIGMDDDVRHKLARLLRFPEPDSSRPSGDVAGTLGLARDVCEVLWPQPAVPTQAVPSARTPVATRWDSCGLSAYSIATLGRSCPARLLFPGRDHLAAGTFGYVRSNQRSQRAVGKGRVSAETPWRDYTESALTQVTSLVKSPFTAHELVVSARNTCNEYLYQARLGGAWFRRLDDPQIPQEWPVVTVGAEGAAIQILASVGESADIVAGLPLVSEGRASSRAFLVSNSSDAAHMYEVDPKGRRGPSRDAWVKLSDLWQTCKDSGLPDDQVASEMDRLAASFSIQPAESLLHSVIAQGWDGTMAVFAITGGLAAIATELVELWGVRHAVLLDNGGSVGWHALVQDCDSPSLLVAGANYRPRGTAFLVFTLPGFLHPQGHGALRLFGGCR